MELVVRIVRFVSDDPQPGIVACEFMDAEGRAHTFIDKVPVFTAQNLDAASFYPQPGSAACGVLARWQDARGRELVRITTARPIEIQSTEGLSEFVVLSTQFLNTQRQRMTEPFIDLSAVEIRRTGFDGGHRYIKGRGAVGHYGLCDVYAIFCSRSEELNFDNQFRGQDLRITAQSIEVTAGIGVTLWGCHIVKDQGSGPPNTTMQRENLLEQLVVSLHLNVPERQILGAHSVSAKEIAAIVKRLLETKGVFPPSAKPWAPGETVFEGFFLVKQPSGGVRLAWQRHHPINPYILADQGSSDFANVDDAIWTFIRKEWSNGIDGIGLSFSSDT
jgi:hypothetical protein